MEPRCRFHYSNYPHNCLDGLRLVRPSLQHHAWPMASGGELQLWHPVGTNNGTDLRPCHGQDHRLFQSAQSRGRYGHRCVDDIMGRPPLHNSDLCRTRVHCRNCRTFAATRAMLIKAYRVSNATGDAFECPEGFTTGNTPEHRPAIDESLTAKRLAVCKECSEDSCSIKHQTDCRRRAILCRENFHCPDGRF